MVYFGFYGGVLDKKDSKSCIFNYCYALISLNSKNAKIDFSVSSVIHNTKNLGGISFEKECL